MDRKLFEAFHIGRIKIANRFVRSATCISCNGCFKPGLKGEGIYCVLDR